MLAVTFKELLTYVEVDEVKGGILRRKLGEKNILALDILMNIAEGMQVLQSLDLLKVSNPKLVTISKPIIATDFRLNFLSDRDYITL